MALDVSPTPLPLRDTLARKPVRQPSRGQLAPRPHARHDSLLDSHLGAARSQPAAHNDSSDDEGSVPLLSAAAEELLGVKTTERPSAGTRLPHTARSRAPPTTNGSPASQSYGSLAEALGRERGSARASPSPRVVRLNVGSGSKGHPRRAASVSSVGSGGSPSGAPGRVDMKTPAPRPKSSLAESESADSPPKSGLAGRRSPAVSNYLSSGRASGRETSASPGPGEGGVEAGQASNPSVGRTRNGEHGVQSSLRIKRLGQVTGSFLRGPARRGMIRRQSDDQSLVMAENTPESDEPGGVPVQKRDPISRPASSSSHIRNRSAEPHVRFGSAALLASVDPDSAKPGHVLSVPVDKARETRHEYGSSHSRSPPVSVATSGSLNKRAQPVFKPAPPPALPSRQDQENEPPPTFKRNKAIVDLLGDVDHMMVKDVRPDAKPANGSPLRKPLAPRSNNTPLRPAPPPPPPKMSVLETATATAGASASAAAAQGAKRKRNYISVNGKLFTRLECIGRGGSGRVYRVMAENYKLFALKRVPLEDVDEAAVRGFKGEIDLLRRLDRCERVVRIYDFELNEQRQALSVLMDLGELDLKHLLDPRLDAESGGKFDITFTRYVWREMCECVRAVHEYDVVHSDLKPANFVLIQGMLKLIDFGIANAIQDDTVHVHREQQIGTPNYMAPETLLDANAPIPGGPPHLRSDQGGGGKLMKLGKPSDVWSLGCILYQIVYGRPPFAHLASSMNKVVAITDPRHAIAFPAVGVGKVAVPPGLLRTLRRCLERDPAARPTVEQLLGDGDPFLHPDGPKAGTVPVSQELLGRVQANIVNHIREHGVPSEAELRTWPARFFTSIRQAVEEGRA